MKNPMKMGFTTRLAICSVISYSAMTLVMVILGNVAGMVGGLLYVGVWLTWLAYFGRSGA